MTQRTYTANEAAEELDLTISRIHQFCTAGRLGYTLPKHGRAWVITAHEIARFRSIGELPAGRPKRKQSLGRKKRC